MLESLGGGVIEALSVQNLLVAFAGALLGTTLGLLPGIGSSSGLALLLPLTLSLDPLQALILLAALYYGVEYGATISAVLINTPGDGASLVTMLDGYPMARQGLAGKALAVGAISSFIAGTLSIFLLAMAAPLFSRMALQFGPPEMFALAILGLSTVGGIIGADRRKGAAMAALGVAVAMVGIDSQSGVARYTFGHSWLLGGIGLVPVIIGLVAISELVHQGHESRQGRTEVIKTKMRDMFITKADLRKISGSIGRGGILGFIIGTLPGAGPTVATFLSYDLEKRVAKDKSQFGNGDIRGVASPEATNNAAVNGAFVPTLTLGIPGSGTTAILLGAFISFGIRPGPLLFQQQGDLIWALIGSFYIGNAMLLVLNLPLAPVFASLLRFPFSHIYPLVLPVALIGAFAASRTVTSMWIALGFAFLGYFLKRQGYPVAPAVLGLVLGGIMETQLRRSLSMASGDPSIFLQRPIALVILGLTSMVFLVPFVVSIIKRNSTKKASDDASSSVDID